MKRGSAGLQVKYNVNDAAAAQTTAPSLVSVSTKGPKVSPSVSSAGSNPETKKPKGSFLANDVVVRRKSASNRPTQMSPVIRRYSALSDNGSHAGPASVVESDVYTTATNHSGSQAEIDMASHFSASVASPKLPILPENEIADKKVWARSLKFLVVDDSAPSRTIVSRTLQKLGHTTEQAENGMAFLQKMKNLPEAADAQTIEVAVKLQSLAIPAYDVVLIDDHMPFMNGPEAIDAYYKQGNAKCIIVGVTGSTDEVTEAKFMNSGATAVLGKPLDIAKLKLIVEAELMKYSACIY